MVVTLSVPIGAIAFQNKAAVYAILFRAAAEIARRSAAGGARAATGVDWGGIVAVWRVGLPIGIAAVGEVGVFLAATIYAATRLAMVFTIVEHWTIGAPLAIWLCEWREMGIVGVWIGLATGTVVTTALSIERLLKVEQ